MPKITLTTFGGEAPAIDGRLLPEGKAQTSTDTRVGYGRMEPLRRNTDTGLTVNALAKTIHLYNRDANAGAGFWLEWNSEVNVVPSPIIDDPYAAMYWTGDGAPKMSVASIITAASPYPSNSYLLGIPAPVSAGLPAVGARPAEIPAEAMDLSVVYVLTYVSAYGEEGPPSPASAIADRPDGNPVTLSSIPTAPAGNHNITTKRLYRSTGGEYLFVAELAVATATYQDVVLDDALGSPMESAEYDAPDAGLTGIVLLPNGSMAGYFGNNLCFTPPYLPHAWPASYRVTTASDIQGLAVTSSGLIVTTESQPYVAIGSTPDSIQLEPLDVNQANLSPRSLVDMGEYAIYAGPDGLVGIGGDTAEVITETVFTKPQWQAMDPASMHAYRYDGRYLCFYASGAFMLNPKNGDITSLSDTASGANYDGIRDALYLCQDGAIVSFDADPVKRDAVFKSRIYSVSRSLVMTCMRVKADSYPVAANLYFDGVQAPLVAADNKPFRISGAVRCGELEIEVVSADSVHAVEVATSMSEMIPQ